MVSVALLKCGTVATEDAVRPARRINDVIMFFVFFMILIISCY